METSRRDGAIHKQWLSHSFKWQLATMLSMVSLLLADLAVWALALGCRTLLDIAVCFGYCITSRTPPPPPHLPHGFHTGNYATDFLSLGTSRLVLFMMVSPYMCLSLWGHSREQRYLVVSRISYIWGLSHTKKFDRTEHTVLLNSLNYCLHHWGQLSCHAGWSKKHCSAEDTMWVWSADHVHRTPELLHC